MIDSPPSMDQLLDQLRALTPATDLDAIHLEAGRLAMSHGLVIYPGIPYVHHEAALTSAEMSLDEFVSLAAKVGAALVYLSLDRHASSDDAAELVRDATVHLEGTTAAVQVGFGYAGILHIWEVAAPWLATHADIIERIEEVYTDEEDDNFDEDKLIRELALLPVVRRSRKPPNPDDIAHPEFTDLLQQGRVNARWVLRQAMDQLAHERTQTEQACYQQLDALAVELASTPEFKAAKSAPRRRQIAGEFLTDKNGLALSNLIAEELEARARTMPANRPPAALFDIPS